MAPVRPSQRRVVERRLPRPVPAPASLPEVATNAMQRFGCIQGACEDTCCRDWGIAIDVADLEQMQRVAAKKNVADGLFHLVVLGKAAPGSGTKTFMKLKEDGSCPLLEASGSCSIHRLAGEDALSTTCSVFPRSSLKIPERQLEVTGSLGCPELARLTLLADDGAEQAPSHAPLLPRDYVGKSLNDEPSDAYTASFFDVRKTLLALVDRADFTVSSRLLFAAHLADQIGSYYFAGTTAFEGSERIFSLHKLKRDLAASLDEQQMRALDDELRGFGGAGEAVLTSTISFLLERQKLAHPERFGRLLQKAFASLQSEATGQVAVPGQEVTPAQLLAVLGRRQSELDERLPGLVQKILGNYVRHYILRHAFVDARDLSAYLGRLMVQLAAIRLLLAGHPSVEAMLARASQADDGGILSHAAVEVIQSFTKAITHNLPFLDTVLGANQETGGFSFGRLALYAKFV